MHTAHLDTHPRYTFISILLQTLQFTFSLPSSPFSVLGNQTQCLAHQAHVLLMSYTPSPPFQSLRVYQRITELVHRQIDIIVYPVAQESAV